MGNVSKNQIHLSRLLRYKSGILPKDIAVQDGVSEETVMKSVRAVEVYEHLYSAQHLEQVQIDTILSLSDLEKKALAAALTSKVVYRDPDTNKEVDSEPDHATRLAAVAATTAKAAAIFGRHKPVPGGVNVQMGVAVNMPSVGSGGNSYEERLRAINARRQQPGLPATLVIDVEPDAHSQT
jgi:hypothetical protein